MQMKWKNGRLERVVVVVVVAVGGGGGTVGPQLWKCVPGIHRTDSSRQTLGSAIARVVAVCSLRDAGKLALARPNKKKHHNHPTSLPPPPPSRYTAKSDTYSSRKVQPGHGVQLGQAAKAAL